MSMRIFRQATRIDRYVPPASYNNNPNVRVPAALLWPCLWVRSLRLYVVKTGPRS